MTIREIIYDVREKLKLSTDDIDITDEYIAHLVNVKRVFLLKQRFSKTSRNVPEEVKQMICIDMEKIDDIDGICDIDTRLLRSVQKIPATIEMGDKSAVVNVRTVSIMAKFINLVPMERFPHLGYNKHLKNMTYVAMDADNRLYMKTLDGPSVISNVKVTGVFANPEEAYGSLCETDDVQCDYFDTEYPIEPYIVSDLVTMIVKEMAPSLTIPEDNLNNADESNR